MENKFIIIGIGLLTILTLVALVGAHESENNNQSEWHGMGMMHDMWGEEHNEMIENMEEMMEDEEFREEMVEHMKNCPMMKYHEH